MIRTTATSREEVRENMRNGEGEIIIKHLLEKDEMFDKARMCAKVIVDPGCSIGNHEHGPDAEIYYVLSGTLVMTDCGEEKIVHAGDIMITGNGETHGVENRTEVPAEILAIVLN